MASLPKAAREAMNRNRKLCRLLRLKARDRIVTAYAQPTAGPGWANQPLWVIVRDGDGKLREECLQPEEQPAEVLWLYGIAAKCHAQMVGGLERNL